MRFPLPSSSPSFQQFMAGVTCLGILAHTVGVFAVSQAASQVSPDEQPNQPFPVEALSLEGSLENTQPLVAHHGGEGGGGVAGLAGANAASAITLKAGASKAVLSNSLWGNLLLSMAYQMDPEIQKIVSRIGRVNGTTLLAITGVSGLGLAQSIYTYRHLEPITANVTEAHTPTGHDHVHLPPESKVPATMGIISSGVTLAALGLNAAMMKHYSMRLKARQIALRTAVDEILVQLRESGTTEALQQRLNALVGSMATEEFLLLWSAVYR